MDVNMLEMGSGEKSMSQLGSLMKCDEVLFHRGCSWRMHAVIRCMFLPTAFTGIEIRKNFYMSAGHVTMSD